MNYSDMQIDLILKMLHASNVNKFNSLSYWLVLVFIMGFNIQNFKFSS